MKTKLLKALKFTLVLLPIAAVGGYFTGSYAYASYTPEVQAQIMEQMGSINSLLLVSTLQSAIYALVAGFLGYIIADAVGLMKPIRFEKAKLLRALIVTLVCGILFSLDYWVFGKALPQVAALYDNSVVINRFDNWMASILYGGIIEEVLMRLFLMSLLSLIIWKLFCRKCARGEIPTWVFVVANIISAVAFAAGHIPATVNMFGELSALVLVRCFLLNGALGLVFGRLYRKYGIQYAMLGHMGCHIISKLIWLLFL